MTSNIWNLWGEVKPVDNFPPLSEYASPDRCRRCGSMIWKAICRTGFDTYLDPELLDPMTDIVYYITKRQTYRIHRANKSFTVQYRSTWELKNGKATDFKLAAHVCDPDNVRDTLPDYWITSTYRIPEEPPF